MAPTVAAPARAWRMEPGSFRDRTARVFYTDDGVCRGLTASAWDEWQHLSQTAFFKTGVQSGRIVPTEVLTSPGASLVSSDWTAVLRHRTVPFVTYPYEWCFSMLKDAALLHLELLASALQDGITLKDATPFNVQWVGTRPMFIDIGSFIRWTSGRPWVGYRQFCRMFLYPLMLQAHKDVAYHPWLRGSLDGIDAATLARLLSWRDALRRGVLTHVVAQARIERRYAATRRDLKHELQQAGFSTGIIAAMLGRLQSLVRGLQWSPAPSVWSGYATHNSYDTDAAAAKERFVESAIVAKRRRLVWDLGCNTGRFSTLAARHAEYVVAVDSDHASIECLYRELQARTEQNIVPLVMDVADPSPSLGWRGCERQPMTERGRPDLVLCLALIHHLAITSNIPVADVLEWFAELGSDLVIEFPTADDPMVRKLLLNKDQRYDDYALDYFEAALSARFIVRDRLRLPAGTRHLYYASPRTPVRTS